MNDHETTLWYAERLAAFLAEYEPTAHLDGEALHTVNDALTRLAAGRTTLLVAHRLETIRLARRVIVLDAGRVVADGTHDELITTAPLYASLLATLARDRGQRRRTGEVPAGAARG